MTKGATITGVTAVVKSLQKLKVDAKEASEAEVVTGYTQKYGIYVHENLQARHAEGKQAKFLEAPARRLRDRLASIVVRVYKRTGSLVEAMIIAALRMQRASQKIVPIDTSALKASAFTAKAIDIPAKSAAAFAKSESIRKREKAKRSKKKSK